jgi:hypothetical protein
VKKKYTDKNIIYVILSKGSSVLEDNKIILPGMFFLVLVLFIFEWHRSIFFSAILGLLGAVSLVPARFIRFSHYVGFELCMMATILTSLAYGPFFGAVTGFFSITLGFILSGNFKPSYFISVLALPIIGAVTPLFCEVFHSNLAYLGIFMTLMYDTIILPLYVLIGGSRVFTSIIFFITHVLLNAWVFSVLAPIIYGIMV